MIWAYQLAGAAVVGTLAWWLTHFLVEPWMGFRRLRAQAHETLHFYYAFLTFLQRTSNDEDEKARRTEVRDEVRRMSSRMFAAEGNFLRVHRWWAKRSGLRIREAARQLTGLSNAYGEGAGKHADAVYRCLGLRNPDEFGD